MLALLFITLVASPVSFRADIAPLLQRRCAACHCEDSAKGRYRLDTLARIAKPGESDLPPVVAGKPEESELFLRLIEKLPEDRMPQKADPLPSSEIALVERWIRDGASGDPTDRERPIVELARDAFLRAAPAHYPRPLPVAALAFSPDGTRLAVGGYYEVTIWNIATGALVRRLGGLPERITAIAWEPQRDMIAVAGGSPAQWGAVVLLDSALRYQPRYLCDLPESALSVAFSPDGALLAAGCGDRAVRLFDTISGKQKRTLKQHADWVQSVAFNPDGTLLVTASRDRTARVFRVVSGDLEATYSGHDGPLISALFADDGTVLSLARGRALHAWSAEKGERRFAFDDLTGDPQQFALLPAGLVVANGDKMVGWFARGSTRETFTLLGHDDRVQALAVAPVGETFATGSADGVVCVWSLACGTWIRRFTARP
jgi:hypothetical protein